jgi:hypothetical protein
MILKEIQVVETPRRLSLDLFGIHPARSLDSLHWVAGTHVRQPDGAVPLSGRLFGGVLVEKMTAARPTRKVISLATMIVT